MSAGMVAVVRAHVAQSVEHLHGKEKVIGSIPIVGSTLRSRRRGSAWRTLETAERGFASRRRATFDAPRGVIAAVCG